MDIERIDQCIATLRELSDDLHTINANSKKCMQDALETPGSIGYMEKAPVHA